MAETLGGTKPSRRNDVRMPCARVSSSASAYARIVRSCARQIRRPVSGGAQDRQGTAAIYRSRANFRSQSRSAVGGYGVSVKPEPIEEHKEYGIILDLTGCGQRLNNRAAILESKIT